jgi:hypothetical protein
LPFQPIVVTDSFSGDHWALVSALTEELGGNVMAATATATAAKAVENSSLLPTAYYATWDEEIRRAAFRALQFGNLIFGYQVINDLGDNVWPLEDSLR